MVLTTNYLPRIFNSCLTKIISLIIFSLVLLNSVVFAQQKSIRGKILDASNSQPIAGVSVKVVESGRTSSTDQNGQFTFSDVTVGNTVVVTSVGYLEYSFRIGNQVEYTINLTSTINTIEETVVVGYGTQKRRNVTGS